MSERVITPHRAKTERRAIREALHALRIELREIRKLRASDRPLDREDAEGRLAMAHHEHNRVRQAIRLFREARVEKGSAWSPAAAKRRLGVRS